jgi:cytochrome c5
MLFVAVILSSSLQSCYYDKESELYPVATCDTALVTYSQTIVPIMSANCNVCHSTAVASGGVITDNHADLSTVAANGQLEGAVNHLNGFSPMPKGGSKLSDCNLSKIHIWVRNGSPNN